jgi:hypothetical protein
MHQHRTVQPNVPNDDHDIYKDKIQEFSSPRTHQSPSFSNENLDNLKEIKDADHSYSNWYR